MIAELKKKYYYYYFASRTPGRPNQISMISISGHHIILACSLTQLSAMSITIFLNYKDNIIASTTTTDKAMGFDLNVINIV